jgi:drug/metabolite transporter (DMT)-like permease
MLWTTLSLLTAFATASQDAWVKRYFSHLSTAEMTAFPFLYSVPLFAVVLPFVPVPVLDRVFYGTFLLSIPLHIVPFFLHMKAIQHSPLSLTLPYLAFTPVFLILVGFVVLREVPNAWGIAGILTTCAGGYILNLKKGYRSLLAPVAAIFREKGSWLMLIVAFLYSVSGAVAKKAILHSSPLFFTVSFFTVLGIVMALCMVIIGHARIGVLRKHVGKGFIAGGLLLAHAVFHGFAISLTKAAYMVSVKRLSVLIGFGYGWLIFKEKDLPVRLIGTILMVAGAGLITLRGQ